MNALEKLSKLQAEAKTLRPLRPRQWADKILQLKNIDDRRAMLNTVPEDMRPLVEEHVRSYFAMRVKR